MLVQVANSSDLVVVARAQNGAHHHLVRAELGLGRLVEVHDILVDLLGNDGGAVLGPVGAQYNHEVPLGFHGQVALDHALQRPAKRLMELGLDGVQIGVGAAEQNVVEHRFVGARAFHGVIEQVAVMQQRSLDDGHESLFEIAARLGHDVFLQTPAVYTKIGRLDGFDL